MGTADTQIRVCNRKQIHGTVLTESVYDRWRKIDVHIKKI